MLNELIFRMDYARVGIITTVGNPEAWACRVLDEVTEKMAVRGKVRELIKKEWMNTWRSLGGDWSAVSKVADQNIKKCCLNCAYLTDDAICDLYKDRPGEDFFSKEECVEWNGVPF